MHNTNKHHQRKQPPRPPTALCTLCNSDRPNRHPKEHCKAIKCSNTWCGKYFHYASQCRTPPPKNNNQQQVNTTTPYNNQQQVNTMTPYNNQQQVHTTAPYNNQQQPNTMAHNNQQQINTMGSNQQQQQETTQNQQTTPIPQYQQIANYITDMRTEGNITEIQHNTEKKYNIISNSKNNPNNKTRINNKSYTSPTRFRSNNKHWQYIIGSKTKTRNHSSCLQFLQYQRRQ